MLNYVVVWYSVGGGWREMSVCVEMGRVRVYKERLWLTTGWGGDEIAMGWRWDGDGIVMGWRRDGDGIGCT